MPQLIDGQTLMLMVSCSVVITRLLLHADVSVLMPVLAAVILTTDTHATLIFHLKAFSLLEKLSYT